MCDGGALTPPPTGTNNLTTTKSNHYNPMNTPPKSITRKIGLNRGTTRLWIEGKALAESGWTRGTRFFPVFGEKHVEYVRLPDGDEPPAGTRARAVAGTEDRPIIDTNNAKLADIIGGKGTPCYIVITHAVIVASAHPHNA